MVELFSIDNIAFTVIGYPMSYIEFTGTLLYLWSVEGFTIDELATKMIIPRGTLLSKIHRIKKKIRHFLAQELERSEL